MSKLAKGTLLISLHVRMMTAKKSDPAITDKSEGIEVNRASLKTTLSRYKAERGGQ